MSFSESFFSLLVFLLSLALSCWLVDGELDGMVIIVRQTSSIMEARYFDVDMVVAVADSNDAIDVAGYNDRF